MKAENEGLSPASSPEYYKMAVAATLNGETLWAQRDIDPDSGIDYIVGGKIVGSIEPDDDGYRAYLGGECVSGDDAVTKEIAQAILAKAFSQITV